MGQNPTPLGRLIEQVMQSFGLGEKFHGWQAVRRWPEIVGPEIAKQAKAVRFAEGVLTVVVEKDAWRQELEMHLERILFKFRSLPGGNAVKKIVLKAGSFSEKLDGKIDD